MEFRRRSIRIAGVKGGTSTIKVVLQVNIPVQVEKIPDIKKGRTVHLIIEILLRRDFYQGAFS